VIVVDQIDRRGIRLKQSTGQWSGFDFQFHFFNERIQPFFVNPANRHKSNFRIFVGQQFCDARFNLRIVGSFTHQQCEAKPLLCIGGKLEIHKLFVRKRFRKCESCSLLNERVVVAQETDQQQWGDGFVTSANQGRFFEW